MASIKTAIDWIAENDETGIERAHEMQDLISVALVADLFGKDPMEIAVRVINRRRDLGIIGPVARSA